MTAARQLPPARMTTAEFIAWPHERYQLVDGEPRAMAPASAVHGRIQARLARRIDEHLDATGNPCRVFTEPAIVPHVRADTNLRVPELAVTCTRIESGQVALPDPVLLVEILSPGNEVDTRANVWAYATIPSVREIVVLSSWQVAAELLRRSSGGDWPTAPTSLGWDDTLQLDSIGLSCRLADLYEGTPLA